MNQSVIQAKGHWQGERNKAGRELGFDYELHLTVNEDGRIERSISNYFDWTRTCNYRGSDTRRPTGREYVEGALINDVLTLTGYNVTNRALLNETDYAVTVVWFNSGDQLRGTSINQEQYTGCSRDGRFV